MKQQATKQPKATVVVCDHNIKTTKMKAKIIVLSTLFASSQCFSVPGLAQRRRLGPLLASEGGTDWIKDAMGQPKEPEFTQTEIDDMEKLIG